MKNLMYIFSIGVILIGCSSNLKYYTLTPKIVPKSGSKTLNAKNIIGIDEVKVAEYLERKSLGRLESDNRLKIDDNKLWVSSLSSNIQQVLKINLSSLMPSYSFIAYPWSEPIEDKYRLFVTINHFDGDINGTVSLMGRWSLEDRRTNKIIKAESFFYKEKGDSSLDGIVETKSSLLKRLSQEIVRGIKRVINR